MVVPLTEVFLFKLRFFAVIGGSYFKGPKVLLDKYFYYWNIHFCYFCTKSQLKRSQFQRMGVKITEFYLFEFVVLGESSFKAQKNLLGEYFYHWNVHFCYFWTKNCLWRITVSEEGRCTLSDFISFFMVRV